MTILVAVVAGLALGLTLGALGGGGSVLAVPVLIYLLGESPAEATTGSLVVVGLSAVVAAVTARRRGAVMLGHGLAFGVVAIGGAAVGATWSSRVPAPVLLAAFSLLLLVVAAVLAARQLRAAVPGGAAPVRRPVDPTRPDDPLVRLSPDLARSWPTVVKVVGTATGVGLLTGFLGVGGGFLVVPALVLALGLPWSTPPARRWWSSPSPPPQRWPSASVPAACRTGRRWSSSRWPPPPGPTPAHEPRPGSTPGG